MEDGGDSPYLTRAEQARGLIGITCGGFAA